MPVDPPSPATPASGGDVVAEVLRAHGVPAVFTLCGGHISPILVGALRRDIRIVDVRHEASAVFAADALARLTGVPGVAAVTAGPGVTNTVTAVKNAQLAQSPVVILGGAAATLLRGRGALQDVDQLSVLRSCVKWSRRVTRIRDIPDALDHALRVCSSGVPGPVFVELPIDLLYPESITREEYEPLTSSRSGGIGARVLGWYVGRHLDSVFGGTREAPGVGGRAPPDDVEPRLVRRAAAMLRQAKRPVLIVGSQAVLETDRVDALARGLSGLRVPTFLSGMARGLLGREDPAFIPHRRRKALDDADLVLLAGVPADFRLGYGRHIKAATTVVSVNRGQSDLMLNLNPDLAVHGDPGRFLTALAREAGKLDHADWLARLRGEADDREAEIQDQSEAATELPNPLALCKAIDEVMADDSVIVADGGDFVGTAAYIVRPRGPLRWLDPGPFGTLGVGGGFALGAKLARPGAEVWVLYGDGSSAYSLAEIDTCVRLGLPVIMVIGNDSAWSQIARDQVEMLGDPVGTVLRRTAYHTVGEGYGARGLVIDDPARMHEVLRQAQEIARAGTPVVINAHIATTDFRKGSISV